MMIIMLFIDKILSGKNRIFFLERSPAFGRPSPLPELTRLVLQEDFIQFSRRENLKL
jgi:hypothetical protein